MKDKFKLLFYSEYAGVLNNYKNISITDLEEIINQYRITKPDSTNYSVGKRDRNFFVHDIEKIKKDYIHEAPYLLDDNTLVKTSSKTEIGYKKLGELTDMYEKDLCKELWFISNDKKIIYPFDIIDIETPLSYKMGDKYGNLDMCGVSLNNKKITISLIEAKPMSTSETLLRACIETITYRYIIEENKDRFINDFIKYMKSYNGFAPQATKIKDLLLNSDDYEIEIKSLILVPKKLYLDKYPSDESKSYVDILYDNYHNDIDFYYVEYDTKNDVIYKKKEERTSSLFKKESYPKIYKYAKNK